MKRARTRQRDPEVRAWTDGLVVDNFAGGGGASTGIVEALGRDADIAVNHDSQAIAMHMANHPATKHYVEDIFQVDPREATKGQPVALAWFSPDCTHFSRARGSKPVTKKIRGLAWVVVKWAREVRPRVLIVENVPEFVTWGPLLPNGEPDPDHAGETFVEWVETLQRLGYEVDWRELTACDHGAPTRRTRLFLIARCDDQPISWPEITHGPDGSRPYRTAAECIDWSTPVKSIFDESRRPLAAKTLERIAKGVKRYVLDAAEPFIVRTGHYSQSTKLTFRGQPLAKPLGVICATNDKSLVVPSVRPAGTTGPGSPGPLVAHFMLKHFTGVVGRPSGEPLGTITAKPQLAIGTATLEPAGTGEDRATRTAAFLMKYYGTAVGLDARQPLHTITSKDRFALVEVEFGGERWEITDIGMRMLTPGELYAAQGFPADYVIDPDDPKRPGKKISATTQKRLVGNSVCPDIARAIVQAQAA